jgi:hypothetical protein
MTRPRARLRVLRLFLRCAGIRLETAVHHLVAIIQLLGVSADEVVRLTYKRHTECSGLATAPCFLIALTAGKLAAFADQLTQRVGEDDAFTA